MLRLGFRSSARGAAAALAWLLPVLLAGVARAQDAENCLACHRMTGLSRLDAETGQVHAYWCSADYLLFNKGAHARLRCTDCHARDEVMVVPHKPVSPVDCTRQCHITRADGPELRFSHAGVARMLERSAHRDEALRQLMLSGGKPLNPGQSMCLNCHDEPVFRTDAMHGLGLNGDAPARCDVCHQTQVPLDAAFMLRHVAARLRTSRTTLETAQVCAVCHSDAARLAATGRTDPVAGYFRSFHGKAALLGDREAAGCIDCHVRGGLNAHLMLGPGDAASSVSRDHAADACVRCHRQAAVAISDMSVHLDLPSSAGSLDFAVAAFFILVTIATFVPSALLVLLELTQLVVGRHSPQLGPVKALAERVLRHPDGAQRLARFTGSQRVQHWVLALLFVLLVVTGFPLKFADQRWAAATVEALGGLAVTRSVHHWAGLALMAGFALHLFTAVGGALRRARQPGSGGRPIGLWRALLNLPMVMTPADLKGLGRLLLYYVGLRRERPTFGRFSPSEKFEYFGVLWGTTLLGATGLLLLGPQLTSHLLGGRALNIATIAHTYEAFLAVIHVGILHICNVMLSPTVFPLSLATLTGATPLQKLSEDNGEFVRDAARALGVEGDGSGPSEVGHG